MEIKYILSTLVVSFLLISCNEPGKESSKMTTEVPKQSQAEIKSTIEKTNQAITESIKSGDIETASQYFDEDMKQYISGQPASSNRQAWIGTQNVVKEFGEWDLQLEVIELEVSGDIAVERGIGLQTFTANANSPIPSFSDTGNYMVMWKKVDDSWKIKWDYVVISN